MTRNKLDNFSTVYRKEIVWLRWYFLRDKSDPQKTVLEKKIYDCIKNKDEKTGKRFIIIQYITKSMLERTDDRMLKALKEVYVYKNISVVGAAQSILFLSQTQAYVYLNKWFGEYSNFVFDLIDV